MTTVNLTATELMKLPIETRRRVLADAATKAEADGMYEPTIRQVCEDFKSGLSVVGLARKYGRTMAQIERLLRRGMKS